MKNYGDVDAALRGGDEGVNSVRGTSEGVGVIRDGYLSVEGMLWKGKRVVV